MKYPLDITIKPFNVEHKYYIKDFCYFVLNKFVSPRIIPKLSIEINLNESYTNTTHLALTSWEDSNVNPREFKVNICCSLHTSSYKFWRSLSHEAVHIKQYVEGEMMDSIKFNNSVKWQGVWMDTSTGPHYDFPWEIEANGREYFLLLEWCEDRKHDAKLKHIILGDKDF